ncbi:MAG TPA: hypothetical protein PLL06_14740 [Acidobacteriota bacterium]|nr:hypothetical protein [Acidobacteriota bacterium]HNB73460.1 hypothetical protein [Acidobacteriota bacterium]HND22450.1 hypothetical protein [Acidobacteriota bacterium]HNH82578.1 hypothetical protein [Acidobacteriota bacterium]
MRKLQLLMVIGYGGLIGVGLGLHLTSSVVLARPEFLQEARDLGYTVKNCQYCHLMPTSKGLNDRGKFLVAEKERRNAEEVDVSWLKDYKEQTSNKEK